MRFSILLLSLTVTGCTQDFNVFAGDASFSADATSDASSDATTFDTGNDAVATDGGPLVFQCNGNPVSDCSQCSGSPMPCVYCATQGSSLAGRCTQLGSSCFNGAPNGYQLCSCQNSSTCPEGYDVCRNGSCRTCAESTNNNGLTCQGGGKCNPADGGCI